MLISSQERDVVAIRVARSNGMAVNGFVKL